MAKQDTREHILNTAEELFAEHGIAAVSLRKVIGAADVNLSAVHYHFGSKDELVKEVYRRRLIEVNDQRLVLLNELREKHGENAIPTRELLRAFLSPPLTLGGSQQGGKNFFRLVARAHAETDEIVTAVLFQELKDIVAEFTTEFQRTIPDMNPRERMMRLAFIAGSMVQAVLLPLKSQFMKNFALGEADYEETLEMLIAFCADGVEAKGVLSD